MTTLEESIHLLIELDGLLISHPSGWPARANALIQRLYDNVKAVKDMYEPPLDTSDAGGLGRSSVNSYGQRTH